MYLESINALFSPPESVLRERCCLSFNLCTSGFYALVTDVPVHLQMYRQDCETFGMVVKMLVAKDPNLEKQLQVPLRENLGEIRERCLEDLKHFISELDEAVRQPEPTVCDSTTPPTALTGHKLSKTGINHSSSYWHTGLICSLWDLALWDLLLNRMDFWDTFWIAGLNWFYSTATWRAAQHGRDAVLCCL